MQRCRLLKPDRPGPRRPAEERFLHQRDVSQPPARQLLVNSYICDGMHVGGVYAPQESPRVSTTTTALVIDINRVRRRLD
jgi:hypothetical protein